MKNVTIKIEQKSHPSAKVIIEGKKIRIDRRIIVKECVISLDEIAGNKIEVVMNLDHLRELVKFLQHILNIIDEEDSLKLHVEEGGQNV